MLFIPDCDMDITGYFTTVDGCCLFLVVIGTSLFTFFCHSKWVVLFILGCDMFICFTTLDRCCLFLIVM